MIFLIGSIVLGSILTLWFKLLEKEGISNIQTIVFNYITCVIVGSMVNGYFPVNGEAVKLPWFMWAIVMGIIFISLFNLVGFTTQRFGVALTSVAYKLSMVIPFIFSIYLYNEEATYLKIAGIIIALLAVALTSWPSKKQGDPAIRKGDIKLMVLMIALIFFGSGFLDTMIKYVEQRFLSEGNKNDYLVTAFLSAALTGVLAISYLYLTGKEKFDHRAIWAGIGLGIPNYFSIWCLLKVLKEYGDNSSAIIPINNMGIVLFSTVVAWLLFKEKLSPLNWLGILLALGAIALIAYG